MRRGSLIEAASATVPELISGSAKVACSDMEAAYDRLHGWEPFDPTVPAAPEPVVVKPKATRKKKGGARQDKTMDHSDAFINAMGETKEQKEIPRIRFVEYTKR